MRVLFLEHIISHSQKELQNMLPSLLTHVAKYSLIYIELKQLNHLHAEILRILAMLEVLKGLCQVAESFSENPLAILKRQR